MITQTETNRIYTISVPCENCEAPICEVVKETISLTTYPGCEPLRFDMRRVLGYLHGAYPAHYRGIDEFDNGICANCIEFQGYEDCRDPFECPDDGTCDQVFLWVGDYMIGDPDHAK